MTSKRVVYYSTDSRDLVRSLGGIAGFTAGGLTGFTSAKTHSLGVDISGFAPTIPDLGTLNWQTQTLLAVPVPMGQCGIVKGVWQYLTIGQSVANDDGSTYVEQLPIETPNWSFQDGYVIWHLSVLPGRTRLDRIPSTHSLEGFSGLGTWYDMRFKWGSAPNAVDLGPRVKGPAVLVMWIEVLQTNPETRPLLKPPAGTEYAATKETNFILSFTDAVYQRAAAGLVVEFDRDGLEHS
jgi:hypothetical protein